MYWEFTEINIIQINTKCLLETPKRRNHLEDLDIDRILILKWVLEN